jgi:hypothetical protein
MPETADRSFAGLMSQSGIVVSLRQISDFHSGGLVLLRSNHAAMQQKR